jgi:hypothetical protein
MLKVKVKHKGWLWGVKFKVDKSGSKEYGWFREIGSHGQATIVQNEEKSKNNSRDPGHQ